MRAARLRYICRIEREVAATELPSGELVAGGWETFAANVWCDIRPAGGTEAEGGDRVRAEATHAVECRFVEGVNTRMRLVAPTFGEGAVFDLLDASDPDGGRRKLLMSAKRHDRPEAQA